MRKVIPEDGIVVLDNSVQDLVGAQLLYLCYEHVAAIGGVDVEVCQRTGSHIPPTTRELSNAAGGNIRTVFAA